MAADYNAGVRSYKTGATLDGTELGVLIMGDSGGTATPLNANGGATTLTVTRTAATASAATFLAARATRRQATIVNNSDVVVYLGPATVTVANGFRLSPGDSVVYTGVGLLQQIGAAAAGTGDTAALDEYD